MDIDNKSLFGALREANERALKYRMKYDSDYVGAIFNYIHAFLYEFEQIAEGPLDGYVEEENGKDL